MTGENQLEPRKPPGRGSQAVLRIVLYLLAVGIAMVVSGVLAAPILFHTMPLDQIRTGMPMHLSALTIIYLPYTIAVVILTKYFVILIDKRPFETFGLSRERGWVGELLLGLAIGIGFPALIFGIFCLAGWTKVTGSLFTQPMSRILAVLVETVVALVGVAITEEMIVRGYMLQTLKWAYGATAALVVSSILFGMVHLFNPGATPLAFLGTGGAGLMLGYSYLVTRRLWVPIGWHFGWNFALGPIFGFPVSGIDIPSWIMQRTSGPALLTGGHFGPEASLMMPAVLLLGALIVKLSILHRPSTINH